MPRVWSFRRLDAALELRPTSEAHRLRLMICVCSAVMYRAVRTRMPGGVGRAGYTPALTRFGGAPPG